MAEALPAGWTENLDPGSGNKFYHNATTGETTWERPKPAGGAVAGALPDGWAEHLDPGSGRAFYYKAATGETTWERPQSTPAAAASTAATPGALPEGWAEHFDPAQNRAFYYKAATGETSWERPQSTPVAGTWSLQQANDLGKNPQPPLEVLRSRNCEVLSTYPIGLGSWSSVSKVVDALNGGSLNVQSGLCVLFSSSKDSYWLVWRSDKEKEAEVITSTDAFGR